MIISDSIQECGTDMRIRLDLYLKRTGLVKRRTMAKRLCDSGSILHNGAAGKGSSKVGVGDLIEIIFDSLDEKTSKK